MNYNYVVAFLVCSFFVVGTFGQTDDTLKERTTGQDVADAVVRRIQRSGIFPHDQSFLRRLAYVESRSGVDPRTYRDNYYGGIWQVDENYFNQTRNVFGLNSVYTNIRENWGIEWNNVTWIDLLKPFYSGLAARLYFHRLHLLNSPIPGTVRLQAAHWITHYRPSGNATYFIGEVERLESDEVCQTMMDICLVLDGSSSIQPVPFENAKQFVADLVDSFDLETTRVGFIVYSTDAVTIFDLNNNLTATQMNQTIRSISYPAGMTDTPAGLNLGVQFFNEVNISRPGIPKIIATFTDGVHNRGDLPAALRNVASANLTSFAIGIGNGVNNGELLQIALQDASRVFQVTDYDALREFFYEMTRVTCEVPLEPELGEQNNGTLNQGERRYFSYSVPEEGFTVTLSSTGVVSGWYSFTEETPNSAIHDGVLQSATFIPRPPPTSMSRSTNATTVQVYLTIQNNAEGENNYVLDTQEGNQTTDPTTESPTTERVTPTTPSAGVTLSVPYICTFLLVISSLFAFW